MCFERGGISSFSLDNRIIFYFERTRPITLQLQGTLAAFTTVLPSVNPFRFSEEKKATIQRLHRRRYDAARVVEVGNVSGTATKGERYGTGAQPA